MKWLILLLFTIGCTTLDTKLKTLMGTPVDSVIKSYGAPSRIVKINDTAEIDEWSTPNGCKIDLTIINNIIDKWAYGGTDCRWDEK